MASLLDLDADGVAAVALMFVEGDCLENVLLDRFGPVDYDFEHFNTLKKVLLKAERINPSLRITAVLWQLRPDNAEVAGPVVCGGALPVEGWQPCAMNEALRSAFHMDMKASMQRGGFVSHYYPVKNSDAEIVGVLELLENDWRKNDI